MLIFRGDKSSRFHFNLLFDIKIFKFLLPLIYFCQIKHNDPKLESKYEFLKIKRIKLACPVEVVEALHVL